MAASAPVLLFVHGAGFCKESWGPIMSRVEQSQLLQRVPGVALASLDLPYHGSKRDESVEAQVDFTWHHVTHPGNDWLRWGADAVLEEVKRLGSTGRPVIGIGHSMGAAVLWCSEVHNPGTFAGLVLFEPIYGPPMTSIPNRPNFMADVTLKREWRWPSRETAVAHFGSWPNFQRWNRESLASWLKGAIVAESGGSEAVVLACHPTIEASFYCGPRLWLLEEQQAQVSCLTTFHSGSRTRLFHQKDFVELARRLPYIYTTHAPMENRSHLVVFEDPMACADAILTDLQRLACFQPRRPRL